MEIRHLFSLSLNTRRASSHLLAEVPPCFTGCLLQDAQEKHLEANLTLTGPKGRKANAGLELHGTSLGFASEVTGIKHKEMPDQSRFVRSSRCKGKGRSHRCQPPPFLGQRRSARSAPARQISLSAAQHHFRSKSSLICASHCTSFLPKQQSAFMEERVPQLPPNF